MAKNEIIKEKLRSLFCCKFCKYFNSYDRSSLFGYCFRGGNVLVAYSTDHCGGFKFKDD